MEKVDTSSFLWQYLSEGQKGLIMQGEQLLTQAATQQDSGLTDYSYVVFPFAKAYEGFLKQLFFDLGCITQREYESHKFRIGKALNPHLEHFLRHHSVYDKIIRLCGSHELADNMWNAWKMGRNEVFHYFPHNLKALSLQEAEGIIQTLMNVMEQSVQQCKVKREDVMTREASHHA